MSVQRLTTSLRLDATVQWRNKLYAIGVAFALVNAAVLYFFFSRDVLVQAIPLFFLFSIGGTTLLYVIAMLLFEKDEGTLDAITVSPLTLDEYLVSKMVSLSLIAVVESAVIILISWGVLGFNYALLLLGIFIMGGMLTLLGVVAVVRYDSITDTLVPMLIIGVLSQTPILYFLNIIDSPLLLLVPTAAPEMLLVGAWQGLELWQLVYALGFSAFWFGVFYWWARRAFVQHIILR